MKNRIVRPFLIIAFLLSTFSSIISCTIEEIQLEIDKIENNVTNDNDGPEEENDAPESAIWKATSEISQIKLGMSAEIKLVFEPTETGTELAYEARYRFAEGSGTLAPTQINAAGITTEYETIAPNTFSLTFTPSLLGSQSLIFSLKDENGQELITEINFDVDDVDEKQVLLDIYNSNPKSQTLLGWDINEPDLSIWPRVTLDANGKVIELFLSNIELEILPKTIGNLTQLKILYLSGNKLTTLPAEIGNLTQLTLLSLSRNDLTKVPSEIGNLTQLIVLFLSSNDLTTLPAEIGNLTQLTDLDLSSNDLTTVPPEIGNLTQLKKLYLNNNDLTTVPPEIGNLTQLETLNLLVDNLITIPSVICDLRRSGTFVIIDSGLCE